MKVSASATCDIVTILHVPPGLAELPTGLVLFEPQPTSKRQPLPCRTLLWNERKRRIYTVRQKLLMTALPMVDRDDHGFRITNP